MREHFDRYRGPVNNPRSLRAYHLKFFGCEFLTLINAVAQILFMDYFLGGTFTTYGGDVVKAVNADPADRDDPKE